METDLEYYLVNIRVYFVDDVTYEKYLKENSLASNTNRNSNVPHAVVVDSMKFYDAQQKKHYTLTFLTKEFTILPWKLLKEREDAAGRKD